MNRKIRRVFALIGALCFMLSCVPAYSGTVKAHAEDVYHYIFCGNEQNDMETIKYENNTVTVTYHNGGSFEISDENIKVVTLEGENGYGPVTVSPSAITAKIADLDGGESAHSMGIYTTSDIITASFAPESGYEACLEKKIGDNDVYVYIDSDSEDKTNEIEHFAEDSFPDRMILNVSFYALSPEQPDKTEIILPEDLAELGDPEYCFDKVTFSEDFEFDGIINAKEVVVPEGVTLTLTTTANTVKETWEEYGYGWAAGIYADKLTVAGTVIIENSDIKNIDYDPDYYWSQEYLRNELHFFEECDVTGKGRIIAEGNGIFTSDWDAQITLNVPSFDSIVNDKVSLQTGPYSTINIGGKPWKVTCVSGNEGDDTVRDIYIDGYYPYCVYIFAKPDGTWETDGPIWWGDPLDNEYRVGFSSGSVKVNGKEISEDDFIEFEAGKAIELELVPPAGSTETPMVFINTGYFGRQLGMTEYRSDDYRTEDLYYSKVKKLNITDNKVSYVQNDSNPIEFTVFYSTDELMDYTIDEIDNTYKWGEYYKDAWRWTHGYNAQETLQGYGLEKGWVEPGNEFMVEVTTTGNGDFTMTPGINFYRLGNTAKAMYQGFELYSDVPAIAEPQIIESYIKEGKDVPFQPSSVNIEFIPKSGYQLSRVVIDGKIYSPSGVDGMTYSNGVYTYKITKTPTTDSNIIGNRADDRHYRDAVKITSIQAVFTEIPTYSSDPAPVVVTQAPTPTPEPAVTATPTPTPEVTVTENKDGSTTTTTVVDNKDGSTTTKEVTESSDGTVETVEKTENKDGSVTTETEIKKVDGTKEIETKVEKADGSVKTETEILDKNGKVLTTIEEEITVSKKGTETVTTKVENADGSTSESVVTTTKSGNVESATAAVSAKGKLTITLEKDKTDGTEVTKEFVVAKKGGIKLTNYENNNNKTASIPGSVTIGDETYVVSTIAKNSFASNQILTKVKLPESIEEIGKGAFQNCRNLKKIELGSGITKVSKNAFSGIAKNAVITIKANEEEFNRTVALIRKSGVDKSVSFKRVDPD